MRYWLMKSEPSVFTIEDLEKSPQQTVKWIPTKGNKETIRLEIS